MHYNYLSVVCCSAWMVLSSIASASQCGIIEEEQYLAGTREFRLFVLDLSEGIKDRFGNITETIELCSDPEILTEEHIVSKYPLLKRKYPNANLQNIHCLNVTKWKIGISVTPKMLPRGENPQYGINLAPDDKDDEYEEYFINFKHQEPIEEYYLTFTLLGKLELTRQVGAEIYKNNYCCIPLYQAGGKVNLKALETYDVMLRGINDFVISNVGDIQLSWDACFSRQRL